MLEFEYTHSIRVFKPNQIFFGKCQLGNLSDPTQRRNGGNRSELSEHIDGSLIICSQTNI